jgi:protein required for attachment to host cells
MSKNLNNADQPLTGVTWVVVADAGRADIYSRQKRFSPLESVQCLTDAEARSREHDFASDAPGRSFDSHGQGRHAMEPGQSAKDHLREIFVRQVTDTLESARIANRFQHLVIVAAPALLGELRAQIGGATQKKIVAEVGKHMTGQSPVAIASLIDGQS